MKKKASPVNMTSANPAKFYNWRDIIFIGICITGAVAAFFFFWRDLNAVLARLNDQPVGVISYKYHAAQRRFLDRVLWERLRQESTVYNGDTIRTAELSEASVSLFGQDESINMQELTLIQIFKEKTGMVIDLEAGAVTVQAPSGNIEIRQGGERISAGNGEIYTAMSVGLRPVRQAVVSPAPNAKFLNDSEEPLAVAFSWESGSFGSGQALLEIARDRLFTRITNSINAGNAGASVNLPNGVWYWRVKPASPPAEQAAGKLTVIYAPAPRLVSPAADERFSFRTTRPGIRFQWQSCEGALAYTIEAASSPDMADPVLRTSVQGSGGALVSIVHSGFGEGIWYWRITPEYPRSYRGMGGRSALASFIVERAAELTSPQTFEGNDSAYIEAEDSVTYFTWKQEAEAVSYTFILSERKDLTNPLIEQQVLNNYYALDVKNAGLNPGQYYWGVYQTDSDGSRSKLSQSRLFVVIAGAPPEHSGRRTSAESDTKSELTEEIPAPAAPPPMETVSRPAAGRTAPLPGSPQTAAPVPQPPEQMRVLPAPENLLPLAGYEFTEDEIINIRQVSFRWDAVPGAAAYFFVLSQQTADGSRELLREQIKENSFTLKNLAILDDGEFVWQVSAVSGDSRQAETASSRFTVRISEVGASQGREGGVLFGRD
jgi:hypothetical protein